MEKVEKGRFDRTLIESRGNNQDLEIYPFINHRIINERVKGALDDRWILDART